jgi:preprotein translocase subunit SecE
MSAKTDFQKAVQKFAAEYLNIQTARLGRLDGVTVETGTAGALWARQWNGKEIQVYNRALVPADFDLRVLVGTYRTQPNKWFILQAMEDYLTPAAGGRVAYHHSQHEFGGADVVWVNRKQVTSFSAIVSDPDAFLVQLYGGSVVTPNGVGVLDHQTVDLSSYVPAFGALYVNIEVDDDMTVTVHASDNFGSVLAANPSYVPLPDPGKYILAYILLFQGQTQLIDDYIIVPMPISMLPRSAGLQVHEASADAPLDADEWGFWDVVDAVYKKITWANLKAALKTYFDTIYSALGHTHPASETAGKYRQFVYEVNSGDLVFLTDEDGYPLFNLENLE